MCSFGVYKVAWEQKSKKKLESKVNLHKFLNLNHRKQPVSAGNDYASYIFFIVHEAVPIFCCDPLVSLGKTNNGLGILLKFGIKALKAEILDWQTTNYMYKFDRLSQLRHIQRPNRNKEQEL